MVESGPIFFSLSKTLPMPCERSLPCSRFWMSRNVAKALRDIQKTAASETSVNPSRMLHLRDNTYHRAPARLIVAIPFQYSEIEVIYPCSFVFLSWFWKRFVSWPRLFLRAISKYNPESLLASFTPSTVSGRLKSNSPGEMSLGFQF